mmetsp:Transcript_29129/g.75393  ORF Transcript_29129/g.75393 Transcript_29129/m.75393 type:complete len:115 (+) Transcript_29129:166-510(+)|eukprot:1146599-Pelagomonas_calceolata.AAC.1
MGSLFPGEAKHNSWSMAIGQTPFTCAALQDKSQRELGTGTSKYTTQTSPQTQLQDDGSSNAEEATLHQRPTIVVNLVKADENVSPATDQLGVRAVGHQCKPMKDHPARCSAKTR